MKAVVVALLVALTLGLWPALAHADVAFVPNSVTVVGKVDADAIVFLRVTEPSLATLDLLSIEDIGPVGGGAAPADKISFSEISKTSTADNAIEWRSKLILTGVKPGALFTRNAKLTFVNPATADAPKQLRTASYNLATRLPAISWSVTQAGESLVSPANNELEVTVLANDGPVSNLRIESNSLLEAATGVRMQPSLLKLYDKGQSTCNACKALPVGARVPLVIRFEGDIPAGTYAGAINLAVDESSDAKTVTLASFTRSSSCSRWLGVGVIALGLLIALVTNTLARNFTTVGRALLPATQLVAVAQRLQTRIASYKTSALKTAAALEQVLGELSRSTLVAKGFVPALIPSPFGDPASDGAKYAAYLQARSDRLAGLGFLIDHGFAPALAMKFDAKDSAQQGARQRVLDQLDALADSEILAVDHLASEIPTILAGYETALKPAAPGGFGAAAAVAPARLAAALSERPSLENTILLIESTSSLVWLASFVVSLVSGYAVLIANSPGFGVPSDFVKCFLWGVGLQVAGQQLGQLTASSANTALSLKIPTAS